MICFSVRGLLPPAMKQIAGNQVMFTIISFRFYSSIAVFKFYVNADRPLGRTYLVPFLTFHKHRGNHLQSIFDFVGDSHHVYVAVKC
jgi:hypothetical protein